MSSMTRLTVVDRWWLVLGHQAVARPLLRKQLVKHAHNKGGEVLVLFPTGQMQARTRHELQQTGLANVSVDTVHGACLLHKPEAEALPLLTGHSLIVIDEFPQLSRHHFARAARMWHAAGKLPALLLLGDFHQLGNQRQRQRLLAIRQEGALQEVLAKLG